MAKDIFQMKERLTERDEEVAELKAERSNIKVNNISFHFVLSIAYYSNKSHKAKLLCCTLFMVCST